MLRQIFIGLVLLFTTTVLPAQMPTRLGISTKAATVLADYWTNASKVGFPTEQTFCAYGVATTHEGIPFILIDTVALATTVNKCESPAIGILGFLDGEKYIMEQVNMKLGTLLRTRTDLLFLGEIHGVNNAWNGEAWQLAPLVWAAVRPTVPS